MHIMRNTQFMLAACRHKIAIRGMALLLFGMLAMLAPTLSAQAALSSCDGDPIVTLSNGAIVQMKVHLDISGAQVNQVLYTLHAPVGTSVESVVYTGGPLAGKEVFTLIADETSNRYDGVTFADTQVSASVTAQMKVVVSTLQPISGAVATGRNDQDIYTSVSWSSSVAPVSAAGGMVSAHHAKR